MCIKRKVKDSFVLLKNIWNRDYALFLVPVFLIMLVLNIWNLHDYLAPNKYSKYFINYRMMIMLPIGIVILLVFSIYPYLTGSGRDLLYINRKYILFECIVETVLYGFLLVAEVIFFYRPIMGLRLEIYLRYIICLFMISGIVLCLAYRLRKMTVIVMTLILMYIIEWIADSGVLDVHSIMSWNYDDADYFIEILLMCIIGVFCWRDFANQLRSYHSFDD
ncbi:MAG: hypothetical protein K2K56_14450 [Lachnospiraceae bacterium]|nr:hypothetical protein [Lachnospiraceae bacterium]